MNWDRQLTMRQLHLELFQAHRQLMQDGLGSDSKLQRLIELVGEEVNKYQGGWGREGTGADMPLSLGQWETQFSGIGRYLT